MSLHACFQLNHGDFHLDATLDLPARGISALFGPSGSGKTTLLRCIAGLESQAQGQLKLGEQHLHDSARGLFVPVHQRRIGMVFQDGALFPHLNVEGNLAYAHKRAPAAVRRIGWEQVLDWLDLRPLLARTVHGLSGGERQRVAIGRALLSSPQLLLLDEPLSALDARRKREILPYLQRLQTELDIPLIYISHAMDEVVALADHLVLLEGGRCVAQGSLSATLGRLDLPAEFLDESSVVLDAQVHSIGSDGLARVEAPYGSMLLPAAALLPGQRMRLRIHSRDISLALSRADDSSILNILPAQVAGFQPAAQAGQTMVACQCGGAVLVARISTRSFAALALGAGSPVFVQIKSVGLA